MPQKWLIRENARENISPDNKKEACNHCGYRLLPWYARRDSNPQPSEPESDALSNCATGAYQTQLFKLLNYYSNLFRVCKEEILQKLQLDEKRLNGPRPSAGDGGPGAGSGEVKEEAVFWGQEGEEHQQPCQDESQHQAQVAP